MYFFHENIVSFNVFDGTRCITAQSGRVAVTSRNAYAAVHGETIAASLMTVHASH